jgi:hypothetical protein
MKILLNFMDTKCTINTDIQQMYYEETTYVLVRSLNFFLIFIMGKHLTSVINVNECHILFHILLELHNLRKKFSETELTLL